MNDLFGNDESPQKKGGKARAAKLSPEERSQIAKRGAEARWAPQTELPMATHGSADQPLRIGSAEIPCFVLEDGRRVISQRGMNAALGQRDLDGLGGIGAAQRAHILIHPNQPVRFVVGTCSEVR